MRWESLYRRGIAFSELELLQQEQRERVAQDPALGILLFSEPLPTLTAGISASDSDLLWLREDYFKQGIALEKIHRGGKWTFHGPGQIVVYPIFSLTEAFPRTRVRGYLAAFRNALQSVMQTHLPTSRIVTGSAEIPFGLYHETGIPASYEKVASFGVAVRRGVTAHGAAVYHSGLQAFPGIIPCGLRSGRQTSLLQLGWSMDWQATADLFMRAIVQEFETADVKG